MNPSSKVRYAETYDEYVAKFKKEIRPKTKDDTFTPPAVYDCVKEWVLYTYSGFTEGDIVRPFWPGEDYTKFDYPEGCLVLDNPPFSILASIIKWYLEKGIHFFLFAPHLSFVNGLRYCNGVACDAKVVYENGANVSTSFITDLGPKLKIAGTLNHSLEQLSGRNKAKANHVYSPGIHSGAGLGKFARAGRDINLPSAEFAKSDGDYEIFGGGVQLSEDDDARLRALRPDKY